MKIAFVDTYSNSLGGAPRSMLTLCKSLKVAGFSPVYVSTKEGVIGHEAISVGCDVIYTACDLTLPSRKNRNGFKGLLNLFYHNLRSLKVFRLKYDYVCINEPRVFVYYLLPLLFSGTKILYYVRINENLGFIHKLACVLSHRILLISSDSFNSFDSKLVQKYFPKFRTVHTGFDLPCLPFKSEIHLEPIKACFVGSYCKRKNQDFLIRALLLSKRNIEMHFFGPIHDLIYYEELKSLADSDETVSFIFHEHVDNINEVMVQFDLFLFSSLREGLPRVVVEALHSGLYVLTTLTDGVSDIITNDYLGRVVDTNDCITFSKFIHDIDNKVFSSIYRQKRRDYVRSHFSVESYRNTFLNSIRDL